MEQLLDGILRVSADFDKIEHSAEVMLDPILAEEAEKISDLLGNFYQMAGEVAYMRAASLGAEGG